MQPSDESVQSVRISATGRRCCVHRTPVASGRRGIGSRLGFSRVFLLAVVVMCAMLSIPSTSSTMALAGEVKDFLDDEVFAGDGEGPTLEAVNGSLFTEDGKLVRRQAPPPGMVVSIFSVGFMKCW